MRSSSLFCNPGEREIQGDSSQNRGTRDWTRDSPCTWSILVPFPGSFWSLHSSPYRSMISMTETTRGGILWGNTQLNVWRRLGLEKRWAHFWLDLCWVFSWVPPSWWTSPPASPPAASSALKANERRIKNWHGWAIKATNPHFRFHPSRPPDSSPWLRVLWSRTLRVLISSCSLITLRTKAGTKQDGLNDIWLCGVKTNADFVPQMDSLWAVWASPVLVSVAMALSKSALVSDEDGSEKSRAEDESSEP